MEKLNTIINKKAFSYIALFTGIISMLFIGQEKQIGIFAWLAPLFLLHYTRKPGVFRMVLFFVLMVICGYFTQRTHNLFNDFKLGAINGIAYGLVHTIIYLVDRVLYQKRKRFIHTLVFAAVYVVVEAVVTSAIGTSGLLAQTQFSFTPLAQFSTITGLFGITFMVSWLASVIHWITENQFKPIYIKKSMIYYGGAFTLIMVYGSVRMVSQPTVTQTVKVATISGKATLHQMVEQENETFTALAKNPNTKIPTSFFSGEADILVLIENTREAAKSGAKIIVWNEAALILNIDQTNTVLTKVKSIAKDNNTYVLIAFFEESGKSDALPLNNKSILVTNQGKIAWEYKKSHPTPSELPLVNPGNSIVPFVDTEYGRIGNVICYDLDFPDLMMQANKNNVDIMLVPAYDWEGFAAMHSKMAQFETLQSGRSLIRSNGNGINIVTNNYGKIISELNTFTSEEKILYADLPLGSTTTIYAIIGNVFVLVCFVVLVIAIVSKIRSKRKMKRERAV